MTSIIARLRTGIRFALVGSSACAAMVVLAGCAGDAATTAPPPPLPPAQSSVGSVTIDQFGFDGQIKMNVLDQVTLTATVRDTLGTVLTGQTVTWSSSATTVAAVSSAGVVIAAGPGIATITAASGGKSGTQVVQVIALNLTSYQLSVLVTDTAGRAVPGVGVQNVYYGARPASCTECNIPYGGYVAGTTDSTGTFVGHFAADPDGMDQWAGGPHAFAYVVTSGLGYETDRRFVMGTTSSFTEGIRLRPITQLHSGDSLSLTITSTDPVYQALDTSPAEFASTVCRSFRILALSGGILKTVVTPTVAGAALPFVEVDYPDESDVLTFANGTVVTQVRAGDVLEIRVATMIRPGAPDQSFSVHTGIAP